MSLNLSQMGQIKILAKKEAGVKSPQSVFLL